RLQASVLDQRDSAALSTETAHPTNMTAAPSRAVNMSRNWRRKGDENIFCPPSGGWHYIFVRFHTDSKLI
ncbi:MAG: hypothetical protein KGJ55_10990, partial [Gammaproteobacteria bacterium]|nr:hypothetical protein [Gammaproteobacteria bacterium]